jgi:hypothetical protein
LENSKLVEQLDHPALRLITARPDIFVRQGSVVATHRRRNGRTFGPYYVLAYRDGGRQRAVYLGRAGLLVEKVRHALAALEGPRIQSRRLVGLQRQILASLRVEKLHLGALLRPFGLRLKGFEVRGWRISPLRSLLPRRRRSFSWPSTRTPSIRRRQTADPATRLARFLAMRDGLPSDLNSPRGALG